MLNADWKTRGGNLKIRLAKKLRPAAGGICRFRSVKAGLFAKIEGENMYKYALIAVFALTLVNAGPLAAQKGGAMKPAVKQKTMVFKNADSWVKHVREKLARKQEISPVDFDSYFTDNFFKMTEDPFMEMDNMQKKIDEDIEAERNLFQESYVKWHTMRTEMPELDTQVIPSEDKITVSVKKPAEKPESLKITVKKNTIVIDYSSKVETESMKGGETVKTSSFVESRKIMPVPDMADPAKFTVVDNADRMNIVFAKK